MEEFHVVVVGGPFLLAVNRNHSHLHSGRASAKSALTLRYMRGEFVDIYDPTIEGRFLFHLRIALRNSSSYIESFTRTLEVGGRLVSVCASTGRHTQNLILYSSLKSWIRRGGAVYCH